MNGDMARGGLRVALFSYPTTKHLHIAKLFLPLLLLIKHTIILSIFSAVCILTKEI